jgi:CheY-like chemotaxis protein
MGKLLAVILIVEDNADVREGLALLLRDDGYEVATASNGLEALDRLRGGLAPSLILLDLMMPVMTGWEFRYEQLKDSKLAAVPIVLLTAVADPEREATLLNAVGYLLKTDGYDKILETVRNYVDNQTARSSGHSKSLDSTS